MIFEPLVICFPFLIPILWFFFLENTLLSTLSPNVSQRRKCYSSVLNTIFHSSLGLVRMGSDLNGQIRVNVKTCIIKREKYHVLSRGLGHWITGWRSCQSPPPTHIWEKKVPSKKEIGIHFTSLQSDCMIEESRITDKSVLCRKSSQLCKTNF